jgi:light-independent protochlorophyllide reductase subunit B
MGLEEHLLQMFREDFEFHDGAAASHLPRGAGVASAIPENAQVVAAAVEAVAVAMPAAAPAAADATVVGAAAAGSAPRWSTEGELELKKIPFFVRSKARRNTERFAAERGLSLISVETLYEAKAHFGR